MAKAFFLSERDKEVLQSLLNRFSRTKQNASGRSREDLDDSQASDVLLARAPITGIPPLSEGEFGISAAALNDDVPGYAECTVYSIIPVTPLVGTSPVDTLVSAGFTRRVYNLSTYSIPGYYWVIIAKDKFRSWVVVASHPSAQRVIDTGTGTGTGTGTVQTVIRGPQAPDGGICSLATLQTNDCVVADDGTQILLLSYDSSISRWTSGQVGTALGTGTTHDVMYDYPLGRGIVEFWFDAGAPHLSVDDMELMSCGNGCFSGGPLTGHDSQDNGDCLGQIFTICLDCSPCPSEATGTGTGTVEDQGTIAVACCPDFIPETLTAHITNKTGTCTCLPDSFTMTWNAGLAGWVGTASTTTCSPQNNPTLRLECPGGGNDPTDFRIVSTVCGSLLGSTATIAQCDPLLLVWNGATCGWACGG